MPYNVTRQKKVNDASSTHDLFNYINHTLIHITHLSRKITNVTVMQILYLLVIKRCKEHEMTAEQISWHFYALNTLSTFSPEHLEHRTVLTNSM